MSDFAVTTKAREKQRRVRDGEERRAKGEKKTREEGEAGYSRVGVATTGGGALMRRGDDGAYNSAAPLRRPSNNKIRVIWLKATAKEAIWYQGVAATLITRPAPTTWAS